MSPNQYLSAGVETGFTKINSHKVNYIWVIENFNFHEESGDELKSPLISSNTNEECKWYLSLFPNGETGAKNEISLYLKLKSKRNLFAAFAVHILDNQLRKLYSADKDQDEVVQYNGSKKKTSWGWDCFIKKNDQFKSNYLSNNKLAIRCDLVFSEMDKNDIPDFQVPPCDVIENYAKLYESREFADVVISANGKNYPAHKLILCTRCPVFAAMFNHNTKENEQSRIDIEDIREEVVDEMLRYIYTGKCENLDSLAEDQLAAADKYDLDRLKIMCAEVLFKSLSVENAANILILAEMHNVSLLKSETIKFIVRRFDQVMNSEGWKNVLPNSQLVNEVCLAACHQVFSLRKNRSSKPKNFSQRNKQNQRVYSRYFLKKVNLLLTSA